MTSASWARYLTRSVTLAYIGVMLFIPVSIILWRTFQPGFAQFYAWISTPAAIAALDLSLVVVAVVVPLNVVFGVLTSLLLTRSRFRGRGVLQAIVDLPFAVSPIIVGVALILLWGSAARLALSRTTSESRSSSACPASSSSASSSPCRSWCVRSNGVAGGGDRTGTSCSDTGFGAVADVLADHAADHPVGPDLWHRADHRTHARGIRRGHHGVVQPAGGVPNTDAAGERSIRPRSRVWRVCPLHAVDGGRGGVPRRQDDPGGSPQTGEGVGLTG